MIFLTLLFIIFLKIGCYAKNSCNFRGKQKSKIKCKVKRSKKQNSRKTDGNKFIAKSNFFYNLYL